MPLMNVRLKHFHLKLLHLTYQQVLLLDRSICKISNRVLFLHFLFNIVKKIFVCKNYIFFCNLKILKPIKFCLISLKHTIMTIATTNYQKSKIIFPFVFVKRMLSYLHHYDYQNPNNHLLHFRYCSKLDFVCHNCYQV